MGNKTMTSLSRRAAVFFAAILSIAVLSLSLPVAAQELAPEHLALARKYVDLTDKQSVYETTVVQTAIDTTRQILKMNPQIADKLNAAVGDVVKTYKPRKSELLDQIARIYAQAFTMEELQQIVNFYSSDVGQKLVTSNIVINRQLQQVMQIFQTNLNTEFFSKVKSELKKSGIDI